VQLPKIEKSVIDMLRAYEVVNEIVRDTLLWALGVPRALRVCGLVFGRQVGIVVAERLELRRSPAPILEHLAIDAVSIA
jgi:hypothetical protein